MFQSIEEVGEKLAEQSYVPPESYGGWDPGTCDRVEVVRGVDGLANVAEGLIKVRA